MLCHSFFNNPRRTANGTDYNKVNLLMAVLEKRANLSLSDCDAYVNIAGGIRMNEPAIDLGIVLAIASSKKDIIVREGYHMLWRGGLKRRGARSYHVRAACC